MLGSVYKTAFLLLICFGLAKVVKAQSADSVYNQFLDFNLARLQGETDKVLDLGKKLIPVADKLPEKARINFYASAGKMYEDNNESQKAVPFYEKVAAAVPDYYVVHRALGYIYLYDAEQLKKQLDNNPSSQQLKAGYKNALYKALPQLEKAQACDPSDETLAIIKTLYTKIQDTKGLNTLYSRLKVLSSHCIDILETN